MAYTITFDANGGTPATSTMSVESGVAIGDLPPATRKDYLFIGWYQTDEYGWSLVTPESTFTENTTVTARWIVRSPQGEELTYYYPGANVSSYTSGLGFQFNTDGTAYAYRFCNVGENTGPGYENNSSVTGDVVIPYVVTNANDPNDKTEYVVVSIGQDNSLQSPSQLSGYYNDNLTGITAPITVTQIMRFGLYHCRRVATIILDSIETVGGRGIEPSGGNFPELSMPHLHQSKLSSVNYIQSVQEISSPSLTYAGAGLYGLCPILTDVHLPLLKKVLNSSFYGCSELETVSLPSLESGGAYLFEGCTSLKAVSLPSFSGMFDAFGSCTANQIRVYFGDGCDVRGGHFYVMPAAICMKKGTTIIDGDGITISYDAANPPFKIKLGGLSDIPLWWYDDTDPNLKFSISFDLQGGAGRIGGKIVSYGYAMPTLADLPSRAGYVFGGFFTDPDGLGLKYYNSDCTSARAWDWLENKTLYAKWTGLQYTVTFDPNDVGVEPAPASKTVKNGEPFGELAELNTSPQTGYTLGWWTDALGGNRIWPGTKVEITENQTLYARWTANTYTVTFGKNLGTGGDDYVTATYGQPMPTIAVPTRPGYMFDGYWNTIYNGTRYYNSDGTSAKNWNIASNTTLWAKWVQVEYSVTIKSGYSGGADTSPSFTWSLAAAGVATASIDESTFLSKVGSTSPSTYVFVAVSDGNGGVKWQLGGNDVTLSDYGIGITGTITVDDKLTVYVSKYVYKTSPQNLTIMPPTRTDYKIVGWTFVAVDGSFAAPPSINDSNTTLTIPARTATDFIATPRWRLDLTYDIDFHANGGSGSMDSQTGVEYGSRTNLKPNTFTKDGFVFRSWNTKADGTGNSYSDGADCSWIPKEELTESGGAYSLTLYAMWLEDDGSGKQKKTASDKKSQVQPTANTTIANVPNQTFNRTYEGITYSFHFRTFNGMMYADISVNGESVADGVRCVGGAWLVPQEATDAVGGGNFKFRTLGDAYPWYEDFGETCWLDFYDSSAYAEARKN